MSAPQNPQRWKQRPEGSTWGDFGPDDELGRLNLITPDKVVQAAAEVREGLSFCLSLPLDQPGGARGERFPPRLFPTGEDCCNMSKPLGLRFPGATGATCDDAVEICLQFSTQWDGFSHFGLAFDADGDGVEEVVYYNGWRAGEHIVPAGAVRPAGAHRLGIQTYAEKAIQTRGALVDFERHFGPGRKRIRFEEWQEVLAAQKVEVEAGDILCLHSGVGRVIQGHGGAPDLAALRQAGAELDGSDERILQWITGSGVAAIAADNFAVEWFQKIDDPSQPKALLPLHEHCLFKLGAPLGELWWLSDLADALAQRGRNRFLLTAPPLRLPRAVGSPVTPVATI